MADIVLEQVSKRYGGLLRRRSAAPAVNDLSLTVNHGQLLVIVGPSGCGKTTTLRLIAGLEPVTSGTIRIGSRNVNRIRPADRNVAMVFQEFTLYPHLTARRNIAFPLKTRGFSPGDIDVKVREIAASMGIDQFLERKPGALSGGERQRVALARALAINPNCLLLDEPLSQVDPLLRASLRAQIKSLQMHSKLTTIYVTHDQEEAMMLGDQVAVMRRGTIQQVASPMELYRNPANRFVAEFFGSPAPAMNMILGRIVREDGGLSFQSEPDFRIPIPRAAEQSLAASIDQEVVAGIRPEDFIDRDAASGSPTVLVNLVVELIEWLGDRMNIHGRTHSGQHLVWRRKSNEDTRIGDLMRVSIDVQKVHYFEAGEVGKNLLGP